VQVDWPRDRRHVLAIAREHGFAVLFESRDGGQGPCYLAFDPATGSVSEPIYQRFATSSDASEEAVRELLEECRPGGGRTLHLSGVDVGVLVCGENNVLYNEQTVGNRVSVRHGLAESLFDHVPVILNGAHTVMGNWGKLERRFEFLSRGGRFVFYVTNNDSSAWGRCVRVYHNGARLADGNGANNVPEGVTIRHHPAPDDSYRLVTVDVVGSLLARPRPRVESET
jgi:hypothetical protein